MTGPLGRGLTETNKATPKSKMAKEQPIGATSIERSMAVEMPTSNYQPDPSLIVAIERILQRAGYGPLHLGAWEELRANKAYRIAVDETAPRQEQRSLTSIVIKKARPTAMDRYDPDATEWNPAWRFLADWAGAQFLSALPGEGHHSPHFIGGDREAGVFVLEDLGRGESLYDVLMGADPERAEQALLDHAWALGRLHRDTRGRQGQYARIRDGLGPQVVQYDAQAWCDLSTALHRLHEGFRTIGITPAPGFDKEYDTLAQAIAQPGPFAAYTHCDPCPDNTRLLPGRVQLLDFERSGYHHMLLDGVYYRLCFPTCGYANRLPAPVAAAAEAAYRSILDTSCPEVADDARFGREIVHACVYWIISNDNWMLSSAGEEDHQWGLSTWRQRVLLRLDLVARTTEEYAHLPAMGETARICLRRLHQLWPDVPEMPLYPAFRTALEIAVP